MISLEDNSKEGFFSKFNPLTPYSIENDKFDINNFNELKARSKALMDAETRGLATYDQFPELQQDVFDALYKGSPTLNEDWKIKYDYLLNKEIAKALMESPRYKELRVITQYETLNSTIGTELLSDEVIELLKKLQEQTAAQQAVSDAAGDLEAAGGEEDEGDEEGENKKKGKAKNKLKLEEAKKRLAEALENFKAAVQKPELQKEVNGIAARVNDSVKETSKEIKNWGLERSETFRNSNPHEQMKLVDKFRNNPKLKEIAKYLGKYRILSQVTRAEKTKVGLNSIYNIEQGNNLERLVSSELLRMLSPLQRTQFMSDFIEGKTLQYKIDGKQRKGKGPIVCCIDSSGSMQGIPEVWSKAVALTLLEVAKEQNRDFYAIHFSSGYRGPDLHTNEFKKEDAFSVEQMLDLATYFEGGGTEFIPPLEEARNKIGTDKNYEKSDIVFITDGESAVTNDWLENFMKWKEENKVKIYSVLIDSYDNSDSQLQEFSDHIEKMSNMRDNDKNDSTAMNIFLEI